MAQKSRYTTLFSRRLGADGDVRRSDESHRHPGRHSDSHSGGHSGGHSTTHSGADLVRRGFRRRLAHALALAIARPLAIAHAHALVRRVVQLAHCLQCHENAGAGQHRRSTGQHSSKYGEQFSIKKKKDKYVKIKK